MLVFKRIIIFLNFDTCNVKNMSGMFNECFSLEELNLSNFNTRKTIFMTGIFAGILFFEVFRYFEF